MAVVQRVEFNNVSFTEAITLSNSCTRYSFDCVVAVVCKCVFAIMHYRAKVVLYSENIQVIMTVFTKVVHFLCTIEIL